MNNLYNFFDTTRSELEQTLANFNLKPYAAKQIFEWVYEKDVRDFAAMSNIALKARSELSNYFTFPTLQTKSVQQSKDGTIKMLLTLFDGHHVETVLMRYRYGNVVCVTTQVGCNMGCKFCASGLLKKKRSLTAGEMLQQLLTMNAYMRANGETKLTTHVVLMGIGEPFDNFTNTLRFIELINDPKALAIGARHITVSTCGLVPKIIEFADLKLQVKLAISLHAATDAKRNLIMPINSAYPLRELMDAVRYYERVTNKRITYEYILLKDFNDSVDDALALAQLIKGTMGFVNLIPYNSVDEHDFERAPERNVRAFARTLLQAGVRATVRKEFGIDIDAACGQLRAKEERKDGNR